MMDQRWIGPHGIGRYAAELARRLPGLRPLPLRGSPAAPMDPIRLGLALRRHRPDVFFSPGFNAPLRSPVPFVFCVHDLIHVRFAEESGLLRRAYFRAFVRPAGARAHRVLTDSSFSRETILAWSGWPEERVVVVGLGVAREFRPDGTRHQPGYPYLLHVGNARPHKNRARMLRAFAASGLAPGTKLLLLGAPGPGETELAATLGIREAVRHAGVVPDARLPDYYRGALALVCPSLYEGFGLPALEAMACGTAVAAARATSLPEVLGEAGAFFDPLDVPGMARAMARVATDAALRSRLADAGPRRAAEFSWDRAASEVQAILEEAAAGRAPRRA